MAKGKVGRMEEAWCGEAGDMFVGVPDADGSGENW